MSYKMLRIVMISFAELGRAQNVRKNFPVRKFFAELFFKKAT